MRGLFSQDEHVGLPLRWTSLGLGVCDVERGGIPGIGQPPGCYARGLLSPGWDLLDNTHGPRPHIYLAHLRPVLDHGPGPDRGLAQLCTALVLIMM